MRATTYLLLALLLALAGVTSFAWRQYQELVALRAAASAAEDRAALAARLAELRKRNSELQAQFAALQRDKATAEAVAAAAKGSAKDRGDALAAQFAAAASAANAAEAAKRDEQFELLAALADQPEFQKLLALQQRGRIDTRYAALFRRLNLTPAEQARFETLLADRQSALADAMIAAYGQGLTGKSAREMAGAVAEATQKDITKSIKDLLGPQRFGVFQNYENTMPQRELVTQLAQRLSYSPTPLTPRQQEQLVQTLATTAAAPKPAPGVVAPSSAKPKPTPPIAPLPATLANLGVASVPSAPITPAAVAQSQAFLAPAQVTALQQMRQQQQAQQTLNSVLTTKKAATPAPAPPAPVKAPGR